MKKFLKNLEKELRKTKINEAEIQEILADHEEMIESAINEGLSDEELEAKFGDPDKVAEELSEMAAQRREKRSVSGKEIEFSNVTDGYDVEIHMINEDMEIITHDENTIVIKPFRVKNIEKYTIEFVDNTLTLAAPKTRGFVFGSTGDRRFEIYVPEGLKVNSFHSKSVNGDFEIENLKIKDLNIENTNGDLDFEDLEVGNFKLSIINGDIDIENVKCEEFSASMISGDADIDKLECKNDVFINTISGDISINNSSCHEAMLKTVSGDLDGNEFYPKLVSFKSVSGDITIKNKDRNRPIEVKRKRSVSGDIDIIVAE